MTIAPHRYNPFPGLNSYDQLVASQAEMNLGRPYQNGFHTSNSYNRSPSHGQSSRQNKDQHHRQTNDVLNYQFWPRATGMGTLNGNTFQQMIGAECEYGRDTSKDQGLDNRSPSRSQAQDKGWGKSYLAFDFRREYLVIKSKLKLPRNSLPPALQPVDAELCFDDIASQGIRVQVTGNKIREPGMMGELLEEVIVTACTRRPPKFYTAFNEQLPGMSDNRQPYRRRATAIDFTVGNVIERDAGAITAIPDGPCAYPTFWNTWRWVFHLTGADLNKLRLCQNKLRMLADEDPQMNLVAHGNRKLAIEKLDMTAFTRLYRLPDLSRIPFGPRTLIEGLIAHGILRPGDTPALVEELKRHAVVVSFQCRILESLYNEEKIRDIRKIIPAKARYLRRTAPPTLDHLVLIRTVLVTPTRVLIGPPQQEPSNSVTRRYADKLDGIIRVQFTDEEDRLFIQDYTKQCDMQKPEVGVMARVRRALQHGITIGGESFYPVASSASQQKDHALWFINHRVIDGIVLREWMGSVAETIVAKHAARMGLPFSSTRIVDLNIELGSNLPDVERNGYTFTDGCSVAGLEVMKGAAKALHARGLNASPSAIQFRLGGAKGVLSYWPNLAKPHEVRLRKSLVKFESNLVDLNVVRLAKYQAAFLNRQFIMIMCANGIPDSLILEVFRDAIEEIHGLRRRVSERRITKADINQISTCSEFPLNALIKAGFNDNPFIQDLCEIIECRTLQDLKWRARVKLESGVFLIGIADESGTLREGEIFCQYQENEDTTAVIVENQVLVCRAPALHPGDVRRAIAVDRPELRHLKNVVVISTQGQRDLPNMLGGGDLDGDDYTIIWDQRFVRYLNEYSPVHRTPSHPCAESYTSASQREFRTIHPSMSDRSIETSRQSLMYRNDVLGQVDNAHLARSDAESPFDDGCLRLSEIHSTAVDFAKTGQAATIPPELRPKTWPDFMDRDGMKLIYESKKILGQLFRLVNPDPHFKPCDIKDLQYPVDSRLSELPIYDSLVERLKPIKKAYEHALSWDMRRYRVVEPEIPSGIAIRNKRRKRARDQNLNEPLRDSYNVIVRHTRAEAMKAVQDLTFRTKHTPIMVVARHAYAMTYERKYVEAWELEMKQGFLEAEGEEAEYLRPKPMISFAWVFWQEMVQLVQPDQLQP